MSHVRWHLEKAAIRIRYQEPKATIGGWHRQGDMVANCPRCLRTRRSCVCRFS